MSRATQLILRGVLKAIRLVALTLTRRMTHIRTRTLIHTHTHTHTLTPTL